MILLGRFLCMFLLFLQSFSGPTDATQFSAAANGWAPVTEKWHHFVVTYTGNQADRE